MNLQTKNLALIPFAALVLAIIVNFLFGLSESIVFDPPYLYLVLNVTFWSIAAIATAYVSARSYLLHGSLAVLLIGSSIMVFALSTIVVGFVLTLSANIAITSGAIGYFVSAVIQFATSIVTILGKEETNVVGRKKALLITYVGSIGFVALITSIAWIGAIPPFFESGPTLLRQATIVSASAFFILASLIFWTTYSRSKSTMVFWYSLAVALIGVGLASSLGIKAVGDIPTWLGRFCFYLGTIYLTIAIIKSRRKDTTLFSAWTEAFKGSSKQFAALFANMLNAFVYAKVVVENGKPVDWVYLDVNNSFERIVGLKKKDIIGKKVTEVLPVELKDPADWIDKFGKVAITGEPIQIESYRQSIGKWLKASVYCPERGYFVSILEDITERKKAEEALNQAQDKLQEYATNLERLVEERTKQLKETERMAAIGTTAGMVGHDIRNPLQAITGDLFLAKSELEDLPDNEQKQNAIESLGEIEKNVDYINKIVADLQDYARPLNPRAQETSIKTLLNEIVTKNGIPQNIKVAIEVEDRAERIMADPDYLKRIASNLILNAVQAMPNGGKLAINAYTDKLNHDVLITVKDSGVGIPENVKPKLFTPMMTTKARGQGFGLAVVKRMTEGLGGTVTFESEEGKGTTFMIRLPPPPKKS